MTRNWNEWQPFSGRPDNGHSTKEVEHRFTDLEAGQDRHRDEQHGLEMIVKGHGEKLQVHERAILFLTIAFSALLQEQFPKLALALKSALLH